MPCRCLKKSMQNARRADQKKAGLTPMHTHPIPSTRQAHLGAPGSGLNGRILFAQRSEQKICKKSLS